MGHRSRLAGFIIDCQDIDSDTAAVFWSAALGLRTEPRQQDDDGAQYTELSGAPGGLHLEVQRVSHASRVHLDIEADDIDAEADRLEALGARRIGRIKHWWVMEAPSGHRFCVVKMQHPERGETPNSWA